MTFLIRILTLIPNTVLGTFGGTGPDTVVTTETREDRPLTARAVLRSQRPVNPAFVLTLLSLRLERVLTFAASVLFLQRVLLSPPHADPDRGIRCDGLYVFTALPGRRHLLDFLSPGLAT